MADLVEEALRELVIGNHILADHGVVDAFGHISIRHPERPDRYFLACSRAPEQVALGDLIEFGLDNLPITPESRALYGERPIHGSIYQARPDVNAVCHNHAPATVPFGVTAIPLRPIWHVAAPIGYDIGVWDIADDFGPGNMLVVTPEKGDSLAKALGANTTILMRGHGSTVVAETLRAVVAMSVYLQENAKLLSTSLMLGDHVTYLAREEVEAMTARQLAPVALDRMWNAWKARVE